VEGMMTQEKKRFFSKTKSFFSCWKPILNLSWLDLSKLLFLLDYYEPLT
jgi:ABC-type proline/glycine betaine transport system substrate-binding protein